MRKLVRLAAGLVVAASLFTLSPVVSTPVSPPTAVAEAHDSSAASVCNATQNVATHITAAGNLYAMDVNLCVGRYNIITDCCWTVEAMVRYTCWRNASPVGWLPGDWQSRASLVAKRCVPVDGAGARRGLKTRVELAMQPRTELLV
jgi:hypothetical protein